MLIVIIDYLLQQRDDQLGAESGGDVDVCEVEVGLEAFYLEESLTRREFLARFGLCQILLHPNTPNHLAACSLLTSL